MAASTKGWCTASAIVCDCSRSNVAAIGSASASTGSGRCQSTSAIQADQRGSLADADTMPPAGSQPVRAARKTNASDVMSGGSETQTSDAPRTIIGNVPDRAPVKMPSERPSQRGRQRATRFRAAPCSRPRGQQAAPTGRL